MNPPKEPIHMNAKKEDISSTVIFPGDPLRAKYIAENFLENAKEVTNVRNMLGFTGTYKGKKVTVMGHGMGMPSCGIYAWELFYFYDVQQIIRIGTCGVLSKDVKIPEIILADLLYTESNYAYSYNGYEDKTVIPSYHLVKKIENKAEELNIKIHRGALMTEDVFGPYTNDEAIVKRIPKWINALGTDMEGFALIHIANSFKRNAAVLVSATDSPFAEKKLTPEERTTSLNDMIRLALESIL